MAYCSTTAALSPACTAFNIGFVTRTLSTMLFRTWYKALAFRSSCCAVLISLSLTSAGSSSIFVRKTILGFLNEKEKKLIYLLIIRPELSTTRSLAAVLRVYHILPGSVFPALSSMVEQFEPLLWPQPLPFHHLEPCESLENDQLDICNLALTRDGTDSTRCPEVELK